MAAPSSSAAQQAAKLTKMNLGTSGKVFFGSLCVGTFGLGCWQLERLLEKWDAIEEREEQLALAPIRYGKAPAPKLNTLIADDERTVTVAANSSSSYNKRQPYRRRLLKGTFRHDKEVLIGPRGAPPGVQLPVSGLSAKSKQKSTASGMQPGPQGFFVLTPLQVHQADSDQFSDKDNHKVVWINRGWVPKTLVPGADRPHHRNDPLQKLKIERALRELPPAWNRPKGIVELKAILSQAEKPRFITPEHDYSKRPLQLFWIDGLALKAIAAELYTPEELNQPETAMVTQVVDDGENNDEPTPNEGTLLYPLQPPVSSVGNFKTTPATHVGYAATWFGLSGAGLYMTRKLITKGRF